MDTILGICCSPFAEYSDKAFSFIDKALGNLFESHSELVFIGLLNVKQGKAVIVHNLADESIYDDVYVERQDDKGQTKEE